MWRWCWFLVFALIVKASGQTTSWFFAAEGIRSPEELDAYRKTGMTVLWVQVNYRLDGDFSDYDALLDEADRVKLPYIIALDLRLPPAIQLGFRLAPHDPSYITWLRRWLDIVIPHFRNRPNLIGYALGREVDEAISYDDEGFALFLQSRYQTLEQLSKAWQLSVNSWQISQAAVMQADDGQSPLQYGRPSLDVALYRWLTLQNLLTLWGQEVRARDSNPQHLLFAGPLTTYRSLAVVPPIYQGIIPYISPERAEADWLAHNCHAVAIARRSGRFIVIPMLTTRLKDGRVILPEALIRWTMAAIGMGAKGVVFNSWSAINDVSSVRENLAALTKRVQNEIPENASPVTRTAILYTPFGEGALDSQGFPLYGFAILPGFQTQPLRLSWDEPASLFFSLRFNAWGTVDAITPLELTPEILSRYKVLFAPVASYLEPAMQANLASFVANGGVVIADLGLGAFQADAPFQTLPPLLRELFGLTVIRRIVVGPSVRTNMVVVQPHPLFPNLPQGFEIGNAVGAFGPVLGLMPAARAHYWALLTVARTGKRVVKEDGRTRILAGAPERAAVLINNYGRGFAVFASTFLWTIWSPRDVGFDSFHGSLLERGSSLRIAEGRFVPSVWLSETDRGILVINPTDSPQQVRFLWRTPIFYALTNATVRPTSSLPLAQEVSLTLNPHDWAFLKPIADLSPPVEVTTDASELHGLKVRIGSLSARKVTVRFWLPSEVRQLQVSIESEGAKQKRELSPDQWGRFVLEDVPTPATLTVQPIIK
ncbi:MAG: hypothetical protein N3B10_01880 [Armatimonadetes bacterium]|nr:hypothetical protein [Armatimonadota bacterium]MCX7967218.1 hypothetical protein [Armatimonadota bacterium]MDW8143249.1 hypothetical protein [Armatimonadota bacterium]